ncbi:MAG TPA: TonB-dependent receptor [Verrucomicrobiae bacterium]|nr:TonB-dependent receptor [Verrucomicrobiae bacterium]
MRRLFLTTLSVASLMAGSAWAQDAVDSDVYEGEELIVTAQKRAEALEDVPVSISVLTADSLESSGITNALGLNNMAPALRISSGDAASSPKLYIRGVGLSDFNPNASGAVGIYQDGVYIGSPLAQLSGFYDLAQVEVLRGPQGTLYGRNTNGGAINITTARPTFDFTSNARVEYGEDNAVSFQGGIGGPIVDNLLAFRIAGQWVSSDGYTYDRVTGDDLNATEYFGARAALLFTPTNDLSIYAQVSQFENHGDATAPQHRALFPSSPAVTGSDGYCLPSAYSSGLCTDLLGYADTDDDIRAGAYGPDSGGDTVYVRAGHVQLDWTLGDVDLVAISSYQRADRDGYENTDSSPINMIEINYNSHSHAFTQEFRLQSNDPGAALRWVAGVFYMDETIQDNSTQDVLRALRAPTVGNPLGIDPVNSIAVFGYPYTQQTESLAVFGQADFNITERLIGTFGLRWSEDVRDFDYRSEIEYGLIPILDYRAEESFSAWSGRLGLRYELTPDSNVYATYSRGFKSGGFFGGLATTLDQLEPYDNEQLDAYEIGFKGLFLDRALRLSTAAFYYDYQDQQVFAQVLRAGVTTLVLDNAGSSTVYGGEIEASWSPSEALSLQAGVSLLHAEFEEFISEGQDYGGNRLPQAPEVSFNTGGSYSIPLPSGNEIVINADATYSSKIYFDNSNAERLSQDGVWNTNGQISWRSESGGIEAGIFARNMFDEEWIVAISPIDSLGVDLVTYNRPRSAGVFLRLAN